MGKPVVATKTETMLAFQDYVLLADNKYEFKEMIEEALKQDEASLLQSRKDFAFSHSWENSVEAISKYIVNYNNHLERREVKL